jgi:mRNA-degrading endonuclease RelE of RelBE toxin-antitoxin system
MQIRATEHFKKSFRDLPEKIKTKFNRQIEMLISNFQHPSLHTKKMKGHAYVWEGRVDIQYRFTFQIDQDVLILRKIGHHDILNHP